ncbi:hypothetical protein L7F22_017644 [Adiantum nelumboides]|nr:hypothetical protein [Adiantum nelumboides]
MKCSFAKALVICSLLVGLANGQGSLLSSGFYDASCPSVKTVVANAVAARLQQDPSVAGPLIRMFFHDCFVFGCDGSVLIKSTPNNSAERDAAPNKTIRELGLIDAIKVQLEAVCPGVVSCADIVALAAKEAVVQSGGPDWEVEIGRRDGVTSTAGEASTSLPSSFSKIDSKLDLSLEHVNIDKDDEEYAAHYKQTICESEQYSKAKRGFKLVAVANPALGHQWINKLCNLDWESEHNMALNKLLPIEISYMRASNNHFYSKKNIETGKLDKSAQTAKSSSSNIPYKGGKGNLKEQVQSPSKASKRKKQDHALKENHGECQQIVPSKKKLKDKKGSSKVADEDEDALQAFVHIHLPIQEDILHIAANTKVMKTFFAKLKEVGGFYDYAKVTLIWANPPSRLEPFGENVDLSSWIKLKEEYLQTAISIVVEFLTTDETFIITSVLQRFDVINCVLKNPNLAFRHDMYLETATQFSTLVVVLFSRLERTREFDREAALKVVMPGSFDIHSNKVMELPGGKISLTQDEDGNALRGAAERHEKFSKFLVELCTSEGEIVIDCFADVGIMAKMCEELDCYCISIEADEQCHDCCLSKIGDHFEDM